MVTLFCPENLFTTNSAPSDEDYKKLSHLVAEHEDRIAVLTEQIASLEAERAALFEATAPLKRAISPFRRLPDDIVRCIFAACLDSNLTRNPTMACTKAPVLLTRISSYTRRLALASPELWAALHIPIMTYLRTNKSDRKAIMAARVRGVEEWLLRRAGQIPLCISVHEPRSPYDTIGWNNPFTHQIVDILLQCCTRWRDVSFLLVSTSAVRRITALTAADCPLLRSISLQGRNEGGISGANAWKESQLFRAPALQKFSTTLSEPGHGMPIYEFSINWENITNLTLKGIYVTGTPTLDTALKRAFSASLGSILHQATRLISLNIDIISSADIRGEIYLPFLKVLSVSEGGESNFSPGLLGQIRAPRLETIVYSSILPTAEPPRSLTSLLRHTKTVQGLSITLPRGRSTDVRPIFVYKSILSLCPCLKSLYIGKSDDIHAISLLRDLAGDTVEGEKQLCPELNYFHCDSALIVSPEALYNFFKSKHDDLSGGIRWKAVVLYVLFRDNDPPPDYAKFQRLSPGINLRLTFIEPPPIKRPLDEGAGSLLDNWALPVFLPIHAGFDCIVGYRKVAL